MKPQDIVVILKLLVKGGRSIPYSDLAKELYISPSEVHSSIKRSEKMGLILADSHVVVLQALKEFLVHGIRYVFPAELGTITRGMPTSFGASPLKEELSFSDNEIPVWPDPEGTVRGISFSPLYKTVPAAAKDDEKLYRLLILVDALRSGRARERKLAEDLLNMEISQYAVH